LLGLGEYTDIKINRSNNTSIEFGNFKNSLKWLIETSENHSLSKIIENYNNFRVIENSHYYNEDFNNYCSKIFYIDYPDSFNNVIADRYVDNKILVDPYLRDYHCNQLVTRIGIKKEKVTDNLLRLDARITWKKHLNSLREAGIQPIDIKLLFSFETTVKLIETIIDNKCQKLDEIKKIWAEWYNVNQEFISKLND